MKLNDLLVTDFEFDGVVYPIDLSFDVVLDVYDVLADETLFTNEKIIIALELLLGEKDWKKTDVIQLWKYVYTNFIDLGEAQKPRYDFAGNILPPKANEQFIDIVRDGDFIFSSFLQAYNINLLRMQGQLSWIEFHALLQSLPEDTILQKIVTIRRWKPSKHETREYKQQMKELQKRYSLNDKEVEDEWQMEE